jgi:hypothetical protein
MLVCEGMLDTCDSDTIARDQEPLCYYCNLFRPMIQKATGLDYLPFRQFITPAEMEEVESLVQGLDFEACSGYEYLGIAVGKHARAATIRYFLAGWLDPENPEHFAMLRKKLVHAMVMTRIASRVYTEEKPDRILMLHGIYATWGPFADYFIDKGVDVIVYAQASARFGSFAFARNTREFELIARDTWEDFKQQPLSEEEARQVDELLSARTSGAVGERIIYNQFIAMNDDISNAPSLLSGEGYERRYALFPNLAWDACVESRGSAAFKDLFAWLETTIGYFMEHENYQLIIKLHPAELVWEKGTRSVAEFIAERYPELPGNIYVLPPDTALTAYELLTPGTVCLTYGGTIGLEMAARGVPVLAGGNAHYIDAGIVPKIATAGEYLHLLDNPAHLAKQAEKNRELAKKYAYFYFLRLMIRIPFYRDDIMGKMDWEAMKNINEILDDEGTVLKICRRIVQREDILLPLA